MLHRLEFHLMLTNGNSRLVALCTCPRRAAHSKTEKFDFARLFGFSVFLPSPYATGSRGKAANFPAGEGQVREGGREGGRQGEEVGEEEVEYE